MWTINYRLYFTQKNMLCRKIDDFENRLFFLRANVADFEEILPVFSHKKIFWLSKFVTALWFFNWKVFCAWKRLLCFKDSFYCTFNTIQKRIWLEHKSTLKQIIYTIFTLKNSLMPLKCLSAYCSQKETTSMPSQWWVTHRLTYLQVFQGLS